MRQVVTPEEMAALLDGLREVGEKTGFPRRHAPEKVMSNIQAFSARDRIMPRRDFANGLMTPVDIRWPHS
jgi:hypothetical protein